MTAFAEPIAEIEDAVRETGTEHDIATWGVLDGAQKGMQAALEQRLA